MKPSILIVDDEDVSRLVLREALAKRGYQIEEASSAEDGIKKLRQQPFDLVLLDVQMSGMTGIEAIPKFKDIDPSVIIIMTTALGSKETIMEAISRGAYDYFVKPFKFEEMEVVVKRSLERRKMEVEIQTLREQVNQEFRVESIIGKSGAVRTFLNSSAVSPGRRLRF